MTGIDLYEVLGAARTASQDDITRAYRAQLRKHHPDTRVLDDDAQVAAADDRLQQILAAYAILRDPARRAAYDGRDAAPRIRTRGPQQPPIQAGPALWFPAR